MRSIDFINVLHPNLVLPRGKVSRVADEPTSDWSGTRSIQYLHSARREPNGGASQGRGLSRLYEKMT